MFFFVSSAFLFLIFASVSHAAKSNVVEDTEACPSKILIVERSLNGPPGQRNNWRGRVLLDRWNNLPNVELIITLAASAKFSLPDGNGQVTPIDGGYKITYNQPSSTLRKIDFSVSGKPNRPFPGPTGVFLNGIDICNTIDSSVHVTPVPTHLPDLDSKFNSHTEVSTCGKRQIYHQGLVTHGYPTQEGDWPWHAALYLRVTHDSSKYICGGTLISSESILTAGHCMIEGGHSLSPDRLTVKLGLHNRAVASSNTQEYPVFDVILHQEFNFTSLRHDIALLKLSHRVAFNNYIQPVCLWPKEDITLDNILNKPGVIVGWGLDETDELSDILKKGTMPAVSVTTCLESNPGFFGSLLSEYNFCAGYRNGTSVCNGDSGGGMFFELNNAYYIRGIVSLAVAQETKAICNPRHYAVFTDVAKHLDWIETSIRR